LAGVDIGTKGLGVVRFDNLTVRVGALDDHGVGVLAGGDQIVPLLPANANLLGQVVLVVGLALVGHGYEA
jgi:hypothetical protein